MVLLLMGKTHSLDVGLAVMNHCCDVEDGSSGVQVQPRRSQIGRRRAIQYNYKQTNKLTQEVVVRVLDLEGVCVYICS